VHNSSNQQSNKTEKEIKKDNQIVVLDNNSEYALKNCKYKKLLESTKYGMKPDISEMLNAIDLISYKFAKGRPQSVSSLRKLTKK